MSEPPEPINPFWKLVVAAAALFCVTTLASIAAGFGNPASPVNRFLLQQGAAIVAVEAGVMVALGLLALSVDRRQTRRGRGRGPESEEPESGDEVR